jgi:hypothetical protein
MIAAGDNIGKPFFYCSDLEKTMDEARKDSLRANSHRFVHEISNALTLRDEMKIESKG